jgi:hypothetical protein
MAVPILTPACVGQGASGARSLTLCFAQVAKIAKKSIYPALRAICEPSNVVNPLPFSFKLSIFSLCAFAALRDTLLPHAR